MSDWTKRLKRDVVGMLVGSNDPAISYLARRDLLGERLPGTDALWNLPDCKRVVARQRANGSWRYPGGNKKIRSQTNYDQLETYRQLGILVYRFELNRQHPAIDRAARFLLSFQTDAGDFRGIYGSQFTPNYSAAITELLIKAGYESSREVARSMRWLLSMRQDDGGWALPLRTRGKSLDVTAMRRPPLEPDRSKPSSHLITGIVLRAFAAHDRWRQLEEARDAGELLKTRFFRSDRYPDHRPASHWLTFPIRSGGRTSFPPWTRYCASASHTATRRSAEASTGSLTIRGRTECGRRAATDQRVRLRTNGLPSRCAASSGTHDHTPPALPTQKRTSRGMSPQRSSRL